MEQSGSPFKKYVFVCENERESKKCCSPDGSRLRDLLKKLVKEKGLTSTIRVSRSGCLDVCAQGPNILVMPDNVWFKKVTANDIETIFSKITQ